MIGIIFEQPDKKIVEVRIEGNKVSIRQQDYGVQFYPIKQAFDYRRCLKEFPEIEGNSSWRDKVDDLFKKKLSKYKSQRGKANYVIKEMVKEGNRPMYMQEAGHRPKKLDGYSY